MAREHKLWLSKDIKFAVTSATWCGSSPKNAIHYSRTRGLQSLHNPRIVPNSIFPAALKLQCSSELCEVEVRLKADIRCKTSHSSA